MHRGAGLRPPRRAPRAALASMATALAIGLLGACGGQSLAAPDAPCQIGPGVEQIDVDFDDAPETPFGQAAPGGPVTVRFENVNLSADLWKQVEAAVTLWAPSDCLRPETGPCEGEVGCVRVQAYSERELERRIPEEDWDDTDGLFDGDDRDGVRNGGTITLTLTLFDDTSANGRLATIAHEMGHAFGLRHRRDRDAMMNAETSDDTDPRPDRTDFANLRAIYGAPAG